MEGGIPDLLAAAVRPARTRLTSTARPCDTKGARPGAVGAGAALDAPGRDAYQHASSNQTPQPKPGTSTISNQTRPTPESSRLALPRTGAGRCRNAVTPHPPPGGTRRYTPR